MFTQKYIEWIMSHICLHRNILSESCHTYVYIRLTYVWMSNVIHMSYMCWMSHGTHILNASLYTYIKYITGHVNQVLVPDELPGGLPPNVDFRWGGVCVVVVLGGGGVGGWSCLVCVRVEQVISHKYGMRDVTDMLKGSFHTYDDANLEITLLLRVLISVVINIHVRFILFSLSSKCQALIRDRFEWAACKVFVGNFHQIFSVSP